MHVVTSLHREMLISAHQDQIEQLRESFKTRILEAEKWPEKVQLLSIEVKNTYHSHYSHFTLT